MKKVIKIIVIILIIAVIGALLSGNGKKPNTNTSKTKPTENKKEIVKVDIVAFMNEFDENQLAAEKKYADKIIEVSGYIKNISEDIAGTPYISLDKSPETDFNLTQIKCSFKSANEITGVKKGEKITVRGEFSSQTAGVIQLNNCTIVK